MTSLHRWGLAVAITLAGAVAVPEVATADEVPSSTASRGVDEALMGGLAKHAAKIEEMKKTGAFTMSGKMEALDGDGHATETKEIVMQSTPTATPRDRVVKVVKYLEDGKDKTSEAQTKADERREKRKKNPGAKPSGREDLKMPFLASEQARYNFSVAERDSAGGRVRIAFVPKVDAEDAIKGSAWVDEAAREVLTMGFSFSKNPSFIDHVEVTLTFGLTTSLGRAPSKISFDGRGGFLFIHKHYRGTATISDARVVSF